MGVLTKVPNFVICNQFSWITLLITVNNSILFLLPVTSVTMSNKAFNDYFIAGVCWDTYVSFFHIVPYEETFHSEYQVTSTLWSWWPLPSIHKLNIILDSNVDLASNYVYYHGQIVLTSTDGLVWVHFVGISCRKVMQNRSLEVWEFRPNRLSNPTLDLPSQPDPISILTI